MIHIASGAVNNAVWDLYAKSRKKPLWKLVVDLSPVRKILQSLRSTQHFADRKNSWPLLRSDISLMLSHAKKLLQCSSPESPERLSARLKCAKSGGFSLKYIVGI